MYSLFSKKGDLRLSQNKKDDLLKRVPQAKDEKPEIYAVLKQKDRVNYSIFSEVPIYLFAGVQRDPTGQITNYFIYAEVKKRRI